jgi:hypothetical protein
MVNPAEKQGDSSIMKRFAQFLFIVGVLGVSLVQHSFAAPPPSDNPVPILL